jgi:hypothetical protein
MHFVLESSIDSKSSHVKRRIIICLLRFPRALMRWLISALERPLFAFWRCRLSQRQRRKGPALDFDLEQLTLEV